MSIINQKTLQLGLLYDHNMKQLSKKDHAKRRPTPDQGHYEGKHWCNCRTRNYRYWLGIKKYGHDITSNLLEEYEENGRTGLTQSES
jgi:hypothetical protein